MGGDKLVSVLGEVDAVVVKHAAGVGHEGRAVALDVHRHGALHTPQDTSENRPTRPTAFRSTAGKPHSISSRHPEAVIPEIKAVLGRVLEWWLYLVVEGRHELLGVAGHDVGHARGAHVGAVRPGTLGVRLLTPHSYATRNMRHNDPFLLSHKSMAKSSSGAGQGGAFFCTWRMDAVYNPRTHLAGVRVRVEGAEARALLDVHQRIGHAAAGAARQSQRRTTTAGEFKRASTPTIVLTISKRRITTATLYSGPEILENVINMRMGTHHPSLPVSQSTTCWGERLRV